MRIRSIAIAVLLLPIAAPLCAQETYDMLALGLIDSGHERSFEGMSYRQFMASLVDAGPTDDVESAVAQYLGLDRLADIIHRLKWLGLFDDRQIAVSKGTCLDVLLDRMLARMSYEPGERDMILLHIDALAEFPDGRRERRLATMHVEGIPDGATAMSRAVALPAAIAARLVLEGEIRASGARMPPTLPELFKPALAELANLGFEFTRRTVAV